MLIEQNDQSLTLLNDWQALGRSYKSDQVATEQCQKTLIFLYIMLNQLLNLHTDHIMYDAVKTPRLAYNAALTVKETNVFWAKHPLTPQATNDTPA